MADSTGCKILFEGVMGARWLLGVRRREGKTTSLVANFTSWVFVELGERMKFRGGWLPVEAYNSNRGRNGWIPGSFYFHILFFWRVCTVYVVETSYK